MNVARAESAAVITTRRRVDPEAVISGRVAFSSVRVYNVHAGLHFLARGLDDINENGVEQDEKQYGQDAGESLADVAEHGPPTGAHKLARHYRLT